MKYIRNLAVFMMILIGCSSFSQVKNATVTYKTKLNLKQDSTRVENLDSRRYREMMLDEVANLEMELIVNSGFASFEVLKPVFKSKMQETFHNLAKTIAQVKGVYFSSLEDKSVYEHAFFGAEEYLIVLNEKFDWKLINSKKTISNYKCLMAKTIISYHNRFGKEEQLDVIAWYAPEIPISLGPKNYHGLPGLILEMSIANDVINYYASNIQINQKKIKDISLPTDIKLIEKSEFDKLAKAEYNLFLDQENR